MCHEAVVLRRSIDTPQPEIARNRRLIEETSHRARLSCPQTAYVLATAFHESRLGLWMVDSHDVDVSDSDGVERPLRYRGRGFARLRGRRSYEALAAQLDLPLVDRPELASEPEVAAEILVQGMKFGCFTGRALTDFINDRQVDYRGARQVVAAANDRPTRIAGYARAFEARLEGTTIDDPTSSDVRHVQQQLAVIGWPLVDDGVLDRFTTRAVRDFQSGYCHTVLRTDGHLDPITRVAIETCARSDGFASDHFRFLEFRTAGSTRLSESNRVIRVDRALLHGLETYRHFLGRPVRIACGYRSADHNAAVGGRPDSEHLSGRAVHVRDPALPPEAVAHLEAFTSIGHRHGLAVHLGVSDDRIGPPRVYSIDAAAGSPPAPVFVTPDGRANDSGGQLADAGHRSRPVLSL